MLLFGVQVKRNEVKAKFKINSARVNSTAEFLSRFLTTLTGFTKLMSHSEKLVKYDLRTKMMQQAVQHFSNACNFSSVDKSACLDDTKALTMLLVINALI